MGENIKNSINYIGKGLLISLTFTLIALIILSAVLAYSSISESIETSSIIVINTIYIGIIYILSSTVSMKFSLNINSIIMIITSIIAGAVGGIIGINVNKK